MFHENKIQNIRIPTVCIQVKQKSLIYAHFLIIRVKLTCHTLVFIGKCSITTGANMY